MIWAISKVMNREIVAQISANCQRVRAVQECSGIAPKTQFKKLLVPAVGLTVEGKTQTLPAASGAKEVSFDIQRATDGCSPVKTEFLDGSEQAIAGRDYIHGRKKRQGPPAPAFSETLHDHITFRPLIYLGRRHWAGAARSPS